jgi:hypothetical protein
MGLYLIGFIVSSEWNWRGVCDAILPFSCFLVGIWGYQIWYIPEIKRKKTVRNLNFLK